MKMRILTLAVLGNLSLASCANDDAGTAPLVEIPAPSRDIVTYDCGSQSQIPPTQCEALVALYNSAGGPAWTNSTGWLSDLEPCGWYGVRCREGSVDVLDLENNNLTGTLPAQLGDLTGLDFLSLRLNSLSGPVPVQLGSLSGLMFLHLDDNRLSGPIPSELGDLVELRYLTFHTNRLSGEIPPELGNLTNLENLDLTANALSGTIPPELGDLTGLWYLSLNWNRLSGEIPPELGNLTNLQTLFLSNNELTGPIPPEFGNLASLEGLILVWNHLAGPIPPELGKLANLEWLALDNNDLSGPIPAEFGNLVKMGRLELTSTGISGEIPAALGNLTHLSQLSLGWNELTGGIPTEFGNLTALRALQLPDNHLTGDIPREFGNLTLLEDLYLFGNELTGKIPTELGDLVHLRNLHLAGNQLTGKIPDELGALTDLEHLYLNHNQLDGRIPPEFGNLSQLKALNLQSNKLTGEIPAGLGNLTHLEELLLNGNELSGQVPLPVATLGGSPPLSGNCALMPGNWGLYIPDTRLYREADLDGDGFICALQISGRVGFPNNPVKEVVDLGTLGTHSFARAISPGGLVAGGSFASDGTLHPFVWNKWGEMIDLGTPFAGLQCEARGIDAYALGAGTCCEAFDMETLECQGDPVRAFGFRRYSSGWITEPFPALQNCETASAFSISGGEVAGGCQLRTDWGMSAAMWTYPGAIRFPPVTAHERFSVIRAQGKRSGGGPRVTFYYAGTFETSQGQRHAFIFPDPVTGKAMTRDLGTLGGNFSAANGVNSAGMVVGVSETASGERHAFSWYRGNMRDLGTLGGAMSVATGVNERAQVVGYTEAYSTVVAFLWSGPTGMVALPPLPGAGASAAFAISDKGRVVGTSVRTESGNLFRATLWVLK